MEIHRCVRWIRVRVRVRLMHAMGIIKTNEQWSYSTPHKHEYLCVRMYVRVSLRRLPDSSNKRRQNKSEVRAPGWGQRLIPLEFVTRDAGKTTHTRARTRCRVHYYFIFFGVARWRRAGRPHQVPSPTRKLFYTWLPLRRGRRFFLQRRQRRRGCREGSHWVTSHNIAHGHQVSVSRDPSRTPLIVLVVQHDDGDDAQVPVDATDHPQLTIYIQRKRACQAPRPLCTRTTV